ncbi:MAG: 23S rRNA (pseudouridine(1915)-N(3))-methyltransferase RlmH, partial [Armatimonadetes bacterium]|nr:23S rRNA (pseudouridine(1915)-N(3))-methyltransferase RlmH [Akkermansiaceae bacterium]
MRFLVVMAGKPALAYAKAAVTEYMKRLGRFGSYELLVVKAGESEAVSARLLEATGGCYRIVLDERGHAPTTRKLAKTIDDLEMAGEVKTMAFLIGAA